jgi:hypothetical protein
MKNYYHKISKNNSYRQIKTSRQQIFNLEDLIKRKDQ